MKTYTINIGRLNNYLASNGEILATFESILRLSNMEFIRSDNYRTDGEFKDKYEPTFVAEFQADENDTLRLFQLLSLLNLIYTQECIALSANDRSFNTLYYNYKYEGEKMEFDYDYFLWCE